MRLRRELEATRRMLPAAIKGAPMPIPAPATSVAAPGSEDALAARAPPNLKAKSGVRDELFDGLLQNKRQKMDVDEAEVVDEAGIFCTTA